MGIIQLLLLIIELLKNLQQVSTEEEFVASTAAQKIGDGQIIKWLWDNREEIIEFIGRIIGMLPAGNSEDFKAFLSK